MSLPGSPAVPGPGPTEVLPVRRCAHCDLQVAAFRGCHGHLVGVEPGAVRVRLSGEARGPVMILWDATERHAYRGYVDPEGGDRWAYVEHLPRCSVYLETLHRSASRSGRSRHGSS